MTDKLIKLGNIIADYKNIKEAELKNIADLFGLAKSDFKLITQAPGQVSLLTTDDLSHLNPEFTTTVTRIFIHLEDSERGQFSSYDDYIHTNWKAGDVMTYNWHSIQYCSANAGSNPRNTLQITGVYTEKTTEFINRLKRFGSHQLELTEKSWF